MGEEQKNLVYLSDKIGSEYQSWNKDALVIIKAPTGCGKSHFILNELLNYAMQQGRRILYLVNRTILKDQFIKKCNEQVAELCIRYGQIIKIWDYIRICTYQEIEQKLKCGNADPLNANIQDEKGNPIESYYYVVYDECHYFYADADFNPGTEISYVYLTQSFRHVVQIFMSATIENMEEKIKKDLTYTGGFKLHLKPFKKYEMEIDYDYVDLHYIADNKEILELIKTEKNEKWLIFTDNIDKGNELAKDIRNIHEKYAGDNVVFIDARYKTDESGSDSVRELVDNRLIEKPVIITTSVLDNGVSFEDEGLRNIIIMADSKEEFIQMLGRKRPDGQRVQVYVCKRDKAYFSRKLHYIDTVKSCYDRYAGEIKSMWQSRNVLEQQNVLNTMFSNEATYRLLKRFCYFAVGYIKVGYFAELKIPKLQCFYRNMIKEFETDENAFLKVQAHWLGYSEERIQEFIEGETGQKLEDNRIKLEEELKQLLGENETLVLLSEENKEKLKRNAAIKNLLKFFFNRAENIEDKEKRLEAIGKNDRPMQPEEFNCCMETAQLNYEMVKEEKSFIIRRK